MALSPKQQRFIEEYLVDLNATQAAIRAKYSAKTARQIGEENLTKPVIAAAIQKAMRERSERTQVDADWVINQLKQIAEADPRNLVEYRRYNCRYCWGNGHLYQWTPGEYETAVRDAQLRDKPIPVASGGTDYHAKREPNPDCPDCGGEGRGHIHAHDTRTLKGSAARLYAGVKQGKDGLEIKTLDPMKALELLGRHTGALESKLDQALKQRELDTTADDDKTPPTPVQVVIEVQDARMRTDA